MDIILLREAMTVASFAAFLGIVWFAVSPRNRQRFEEAARLPLDEDDRG
jgi:cytochrome c oxidase cbb3-type subunit 4